MFPYIFAVIHVCMPDVLAITKEQLPQLHARVYTKWSDFYYSLKYTNQIEKIWKIIHKNIPEIEKNDNACQILDFMELFKYKVWFLHSYYKITQAPV